MTPHPAVSESEHAMDEPRIRQSPVLFTDAMVQAILAGTKSQTRRVVSMGNCLVNGAAPCKSHDKDIFSAWANLDFSNAFVDSGPSPAGNPGPYLQVPGGDQTRHRIYPRQQVGDRFWVRETWVQEGGLVTYRADGDWIALMREEDPAAFGQRAAAGRALRWHSGRFLRREHSRIKLEITDVRVQRVRSISEDDARAEGVTLGTQLPAKINGKPGTVAVFEPVRAYAHLWQSINAHRDGCAWQDNPWVWAFTFRKLEGA
jgi:hypothetical protein